MTNQTPEVHGVFPCPVSITKRDTNLSPEEEKEIEDIFEEGMHKNEGNSTSNNYFIFNTKLNFLKRFCEEQLKIYVKTVINPKEKLDFYITQSWLNITKPGESHHNHSHANSIVSGVFYVSTEEDDNIKFTDPNNRAKGILKFEPEEYNIWNSDTWFFPVNTNELLIFPSWLVHQVDPNEKATTDRISLSFNTFAKGIFGDTKNLTELILR